VPFTIQQLSGTETPVPRFEVVQPDGSLIYAPGGLIEQEARELAAWLTIVCEESSQEE